MTINMENNIINTIVTYLRHVTITAVIAAALWGCSDRDVSLENALALAGDNRSELEVVLKHYADDPEKLAAAEWLITNMPGHYSYADTAQAERFYDALDSLLDAMADSSSAALHNGIIALYDRHGVGSFRVVQDLNVVSAGFLIDNIDKAFEQWRTVPWCTALDFDEFCEFILPYKTTETQALKPWRDDYTAMTADSLQRMSSCSLFRISGFQAAEVVNRTLQSRFVFEPESYQVPPMYYRQLTRMRVPFGTCDDLCRAGLSAFRAAGVPVAVDYVPLWGYGNRGHTWGVVHAPNGKDMAFVPVHMSPYTVHKINETMSKVYRRTYARNNDLLTLNASGEWVPATFRNVFQRDVTPLYVDARDLTVDIDARGHKYVYLCSTSDDKWRPVAFTREDGGKATFKDVGRGCVFMVAAYDNDGRMIPLTGALKFDRDGSVDELKARTDSLTDITIYRKSPLLEYAWQVAVLMERGKFEASDDPSFKSFVTAGEVTTPADRAGEVIVPDSIGAHRYWRYIQRGDSARCFVGEITMLAGGEKLNGNGRPIGNFPGGEGMGDARRAFDGDMLTPLSFTRAGEAWVGLDFGQPVAVDMIRYVPRSDGDMIEPGDEYELMYWDDGRWRSLGRKTASTVSIDWSNVPAGGVYVLMNRTKGDSVRIFLINENGEQEWW